MKPLKTGLKASEMQVVGADARTVLPLQLSPDSGVQNFQEHLSGTLDHIRFDVGGATDGLSAAGYRDGTGRHGP